MNLRTARLRGIKCQNLTSIFSPFFLSLDDREERLFAPPSSQHSPCLGIDFFGFLYYSFIGRDVSAQAETLPSNGQVLPQLGRSFLSY
jgi:hypothetical protein